MFDSSVPPFFCNGFMLYYCYFYLFAHTGVRYHSYITRCPCRLTVTRRLQDTLLLANEVRCNQKLQIEEQKTQWHKTKMDIKASNGRQDTIQKSRN
jgi:hypothetical protein